MRHLHLSSRAPSPTTPLSSTATGAATGANRLATCPPPPLGHGARHADLLATLRPPHTLHPHIRPSLPSLSLLSAAAPEPTAPTPAGPIPNGCGAGVDAAQQEEGAPEEEAGGAKPVCSTIAPNDGGTAHGGGLG